MMTHDFELHATPGGRKSGRALAMALGAAVISIAGVAFNITGASSAAAGERLTRAVVSYADLDLRRAADQDRLDRRIDGAARRLCNSLLGLHTNRVRTACIEQSVASAEPQVERAIARATAAWMLAAGPEQIDVTPGEHQH
jgi:UrcA family protein